MDMDNSTSFKQRSAIGFVLPTTRDVQDAKRQTSNKSIYTPTTPYVRKKYSNLHAAGHRGFGFRPTLTKALPLEDSAKAIKKKERDDAKPSRSFWNLFRLCVLYFGIEVMFSIETALAIPILLNLHVSPEAESYIYFISPLLAFFFQPILGVLSDRCQSKFGRRRPYILLLALGAFFGFTLILNNEIIGNILGDQNREKKMAAIASVFLGVTFLDFSADSSDSPLRALLLDVCNSDDQETAFNIHAFLGGMGSSTGFIFGAINWEFLRVIGDEKLILYIFAAIIFVITLLSTLTSVKEVPIVLNDSEDVPLIGTHATEDPEDVDDEDKPITLTLLFGSIKNMPTELFRLIVVQFLSWCAYFSTILFFTDYVGQSIYGGHPHAPKNTTESILYDEGVKMGCWCLLNYSVSSAIAAIIFEKFILQRFSTRTIYFFSYLQYIICCGIMYFTTSIYVILPLCSSFGILLTAINTLPYQMLSEYHQNREYRAKSAPGTKRGIGVDCSLLSSCYFAAQVFVALFMSIFLRFAQNNVILLVADIFGFAGAFWLSCVVIFPEHNPNAPISAHH